MWRCPKKTTVTAIVSSRSPLFGSTYFKIPFGLELVQRTPRFWRRHELGVVVKGCTRKRQEGEQEVGDEHLQRDQRHCWSTIFLEQLHVEERKSRLRSWASPKLYIYLIIGRHPVDGAHVRTPPRTRQPGCSKSIDWTNPTSTHLRRVSSGRVWPLNLARQSVSTGHPEHQSCLVCTMI
jgi:hypothetical protein